MAGGLRGGRHSKHQRRIKGKSFLKTQSKWWRMDRLWWKSTVRWTVRWRSLLYTKPVTVLTLKVFLLNPFSEWFKKLRKHLPKSQPSSEKNAQTWTRYRGRYSTFPPSASFSSFNQKMGKLLNFCKLSMLPELFSLHNSYFFAIILIGQ